MRILETILLTEPFTQELRVGMLDVPEKAFDTYDPDILEGFPVVHPGSYTRALLRHDGSDIEVL